MTPLEKTLEHYYSGEQHSWGGGNIQGVFKLGEYLRGVKFRGFYGEVSFRHFKNVGDRQVFKLAGSF